MRFNTFRARSIRLIGLAFTGLAILLGWRLSLAQQSDDSDFIPVGTSVNALMVALVDHAAHEIWEAGARQTLTGRDWQTVEQHAIQLVASGTLVSLGGTGVADQGWVRAPAWQEWAQTMTDGALAALAAVRNADQDALSDAGGVIVESCVGCHEVFKPDVPTEGIMHIPHYED